jgi:hypothetical protein
MCGIVPAAEPATHRALSASLISWQSEPAARTRPLGWLPWTALALSVLGLADSGYQVYTHFTGTGLLGWRSSAS